MKCESCCQEIPLKTGDIVKLPLGDLAVVASAVLNAFIGPVLPSSVRVIRITGTQAGCMANFPCGQLTVVHGTIRVLRES